MVLRKRLDEIQAQTDAEKEWWEKRRAAISDDFMKELDGDKAGSVAAKGAGSEEDAVLVDANTPASTPAGQGKKKKGKK